MLCHTTAFCRKTTRRAACGCVQALASPLSGFLGDSGTNRVYIVCGGTLLWGAMTAAIGASRTLPEARRLSDIHCALTNAKQAHQYRDRTAFVTCCGLLPPRADSFLEQTENARSVSVCRRQAKWPCLVTHSVSTAHVIWHVYFPQATAWAAINGAGLALVLPCCQSLVADYYSPKARGSGFAFLFTASAIGDYWPLSAPEHP